MLLILIAAMVVLYAGSIRENDTVSRLGGDEFVAVIEGLRSEDDATRAVVFLSASLAAPYEVEGKKVKVTSTAGCALFPSQGDALEDLLKEADVAMYRKNGGSAASGDLSSPD